MKKAFFAILLMTAMLLSCFAGCAQQIPEQTQAAQPEQTESPETTAETVPETTAVPFLPQQRQELPYETLLAAVVLTGLTLQYPDHQLEGLYYQQTHAVTDKMESGGVYACFSAEGESLCIHASPLEEPRSEAGTIDLYENYLGYATFDVSDGGQVALEGYTAVSEEDLSLALEQLYLPTVIEN